MIALWISGGFVAYCAVISLGWYTLVSLVRGRWTRG
jgi:hypothetical protein